MDTVLSEATLAIEADNHTLPDLWVIQNELPKPVQMIGGNFGRSFCLNGKLHVVDDEVYFDPTSQTPVAQRGKSLGVRIVRAEFMEYPVLERLAIDLSERKSPFQALGGGVIV